MTIKNIFTDNDYVYLEFEEDLKDFYPVFCMRLKPELWSIHTNKFKFEKFKNQYRLNLNEIAKFTSSLNPVTCDLMMCNQTTSETIKIAIAFDKVNTSLMFAEGIANFLLYKNNSSGLSLRCDFKDSLIAYINFKNLNEDVANFELFTNAKNFELFLSRRNNPSSAGLYNIEIPVKYTSKNNTCKINLKLTNLLSNNTNNEKALWDFVLKTENRFVICKCGAGFNSNEFAVTNYLMAKFVQSQEGYASLQTLQNINDELNKIKIAVWGSCFSRVAFYSRDFYNPDYKLFYNCCYTAFHQEVVSVMSDKIKYNPDDIDSVIKPSIKAYAFSSLDRTFFEDLKESKPDYLVIDQYVESAHDLIETKDNKFFSLAYYLENSTFDKNIAKKHTYNIFNPDRYELYAKAVDGFVEKLKTIIPEERIVVIRSQPTTKKLENGKIEEWSESMFIKAQQKTWTKYDDMLISRMPNCKVIDMRYGNYHSYNNGWASFNRNHFNIKYYTDLLDNLNKIVLQDLIIKRGEQNAEN